MTTTIGLGTPPLRRGKVIAAASAIALVGAGIASTFTVEPTRSSPVDFQPSPVVTNPVPQVTPVGTTSVGEQVGGPDLGPLRVD